MLLEKTPRPSNGIPHSSRALLCAPSAPTRYAARIVRSSPLSESLTVAVTPSSSCSSPISSVPSRTLAPACAARRRRIGSSPGWVMNRRRHGLNASTPSLRLGMKAAICFSGERLRVRRSRLRAQTPCPIGREPRPRSPRHRNISSVRRWKCAARGKADAPRSRSITVAATPCWARNIAVDNPTRPPPAIRTGASKFLAAIADPPLCGVTLRASLPLHIFPSWFAAPDIARGMPAEAAGRRNPKPFLADDASPVRRSARAASSPARGNSCLHRRSRRRVTCSCGNCLNASRSFHWL